MVCKSPIFCALVVSLCCLIGCEKDGDSSGTLEAVWGKAGISEGRFSKPRAITIDDKDQLYIVDMTARIQVFTREGKYLREWTTPESVAGRPVALGIDRKGQILVGDTHYHRVLIYTPYGELVQTIGGQLGTEPGQFCFVTDCVQDKQGNYYVGEYGDNDRIQKFTADGKFIKQWGSHGNEPGQFLRPQAIVLDDQDQLWVADSCNHRIQVFDTEGKLLKTWGSLGSGPGELSYPYDLVLDGEGHVYVAEYGNMRVQKFTLDGQSLGIWGKAGREPGELWNPWALIRDSKGDIHVLDSNNHRVQRIRM